MRELTHHELVEIVAGIEYKPGWRFAVQPDPYLFPRILIEFEAEDTYRPGRKTKIGCVVEVCAIDRDVVLHRIEDGIARLEGHERLEWLRWRGSRIWNPHPEGPSGPSISHPQGPMLAEAVP